IRLRPRAATRNLGEIFGDPGGSDSGEATSSGASASVDARASSGGAEPEDELHGRRRSAEVFVGAALNCRLVDFAFSEEQEMLRRSAREFLAKECGSKVVRRLMETPDGHDPALWKKIADLGWTALGIPEEYGGVGTFLDLIVVLEEAGRALLPGPFFSTMGLAVPALIEAGTASQKKEVLGAIASGSARPTLAFTEPSGRWDAGSIGLTAKQSGGGWRLDGVKVFVPDVEAADYIVVVARTRGEAEEGVTLFLVQDKPEGMAVRPLETLDMTRRWSEVRFDGVQLGADAVMGAPDK